QLSIPGFPSPDLEAAPSEGERDEVRFPRSRVAPGAHEPTPGPSQEGNFRGSDEGLLPSWEGSGVGWSMARELSPNRMTRWKCGNFSEQRSLRGSALDSSGTN